MRNTMIVLALCGITSLTACHNNARNEGPAESAGRHIDNAANDVHDTAVRAGHDIKEEGREVKNRIRTDDDAEDRAERGRNY
jgi:hypothetical protein